VSFLIWRIEARGLPVRSCLRQRGFTFMDKFEEFGKRIDEELQRLRHFLENEVAPETERRGAIFLREVSEKLSAAANKLESRGAARDAGTAKPQA
jgi:hypothetical protein